MPVQCAELRESLSARLDGESTSDDDVLDRHVEACPGCRSWQEQAVALRRTMLVREAPPVPDLSERILANVVPPRADKWAVRIALAVVGLAQAGLGFGDLLLKGAEHAGHAGTAGMADMPGMTGMTTASHLGSESAAWNIAIGIGLLWAALRPRFATGLLPAFAGFVLVLGIVSAVDASGGDVAAGRLSSHVLVVVGVALLFVLHRQLRRSPAPVPKSARRLPGRPASRRPAA
jgi:predicted anti-sigma-YlaC factor YlaD